MHGLRDRDQDYICEEKDREEDGDIFDGSEGKVYGRFYSPKGDKYVFLADVRKDEKYGWENRGGHGRKMNF